MRLVYLTAIALVLLSTTSMSAKIIGQEVTYEQAGTVLKGYLSYEDTIEGKRPGVLVVHEWWGNNGYARTRADMLARMGYVALAVDMYGEGQILHHPEDAKQFAMTVMSDLVTAEMRFDAALVFLLEQPLTDPEHIAAIGSCFGGSIVLNMAFMGSPVDGVVSFHGSLPVEDIAPGDGTTAAILVCNGADDPMVTSEQIQKFKDLCRAQSIDMTFKNYANATHSFTNPNADDLAKLYGLPLAYNPDVDQQSWQDMTVFLKRIFEQ